MSRRKLTEAGGSWLLVLFALVTFMGVAPDISAHTPDRPHNYKLKPLLWKEDPFPSDTYCLTLRQAVGIIRQNHYREIKTTKELIERAETAYWGSFFYLTGEGLAEAKRQYPAKS